jgi:nucleoside-diphosphate-sugar epimerase
MLVAAIGEKVARGEPVTVAPRINDSSDSDGLRTTPLFAPEAARITVELLERSASGVYNLAGAQVLTVRAIAEAAGRALGTSPRFTISEQPRAFDLIADSRKLSSEVRVLVSTERAIEETFAAPCGAIEWEATV